MKLNGNRQVQGILRGFDPFMNLVLDEAMELASTGEHNNIGMVVCYFVIYSDYVIHYLYFIFHILYISYT